MNGLIALRFIQGCSVACAVTNGAGTIADIVPSYRRGAAMSLFTVGLLVGPVAGPIGGSYLAHAAGWRWVFWLLTIMVCLFQSQSKEIYDLQIKFSAKS